MSIGVFSTATLVSIKALRLYHEVRELYVVSTNLAGNLLPDSELRTEIAWPIADQKPSQLPSNP